MNLEEYYKILAKNIRIERVKNEISQFQLAEMAEVSLDTIGNIERADGNPTLATLIMIAKVLKVDLNTLLPLKW